jgi:hypothetical protein
MTQKYNEELLAEMYVTLGKTKMWTIVAIISLFIQIIFTILTWQ